MQSPVSSPAVYVICCRCGKPCEAHAEEEGYTVRALWWLWCDACLKQLKTRARLRDVCLN